MYFDTRQTLEVSIGYSRVAWHLPDTASPQASPLIMLRRASLDLARAALACCEMNPHVYKCTRMHTHAHTYTHANAQTVMMIGA
jgi:hypothetical protein